jgi:hypothetical protein
MTNHKRKSKAKNYKNTSIKYKENNINSNNLLYRTSFIFITNALAALYMKNYIYSLLFLLLTVTSICIHSKVDFYKNSRTTICILDKIMIGCIVIYGAYIFYTKSDKSIILNIIIIITFLTCIWLYYYGSYTNDLCFHKDILIAENYHAILHMIGSLGHHMIIFM